MAKRQGWVAHHAHMLQGGKVLPQLGVAGQHALQLSILGFRHTAGCRPAPTKQGMAIPLACLASGGCCEVIIDHCHCVVA